MKRQEALAQKINQPRRCQSGGKRSKQPPHVEGQRPDAPMRIDCFTPHKIKSLYRLLGLPWQSLSHRLRYQYYHLPYYSPPSIIHRRDQIAANWLALCY